LLFFPGCGKNTERNETMKPRYFWTGLYVLFFLSCTLLFFYGKAYYMAPLAQKVRHPLHPFLRQTGTWGHLFGILGTAFILLLLLYSIRKRFRFARKWGHLGTWLNIHIFLGITGPSLVLFHTAFKFSGIVSIAFWSMMLVVTSGVVGKYIYELIPHSISGMELNRIELEAEEIGLTFEMRKLIPASSPFWKTLADLENHKPNMTLFEPLMLVLESFSLRRHLSGLLKRIPGLEPKKQKKLLSLVVKRHTLSRKAAVMQQTSRILHYWHLFHKPFVIIMFLILVIHLYIAIRMGYTWIF